MAGLASFERLIETLVERSMIAPLRGKLQPIEIAKRVERAMRESALASVDAQIAPNEYQVLLNPDDFASLANARRLVEGELARHVAQTGSAEGYVFLTAPTVSLVSSQNVPRRSLKVVAEMKDLLDAADTPPRPRRPGQPGTPSAAPAQAPPPRADRAAKTDHVDAANARWTLDFGGWRAPVPHRAVIVGRALDCDVIVPSPRVSRHHAELRPGSDGLELRDLGSTNGTTVDGQPVADTIVVLPGARIAFGGIEARLEAADTGRSA
jgi:hypothetical protein